MRLAALVAPALLAALILSLAPATASLPQVRPGVDALLADPDLVQGKRIGLVTHQAGVTRDGHWTAAALARLPGVRLSALFAPEHGIDGADDAGEYELTRPRPAVYSLYGGTFRPTRKMLSQVDVLVVDLQDVGVRSYTYASTTALVMAAAREARKPVIILDRPNPLGGVTVDGPVLQPKYRSFIGLYPIPYIHGLTIGELAQLYNQSFGIGANLTVIPMQGWKRRLIWADTGLEWVNPSPGIIADDIPFYYATTGAVDGTNLWNGVLTPLRFRVVVAPWIDGPRLAERLNRHNLPGVRFAPAAVPHPRTGRLWQGVQLHITDPRVFRPSTTTVYILAEIRRLHGSKLVFKRPRRGQYLFDRVWGTKQVRLAIRRGEPASVIVARWQPGLEGFQQLRKRYLLYR